MQREQGAFADALELALQAEEGAQANGEGRLLAECARLVTLMHARLRNQETAVRAGRRALLLQKQVGAVRAETETLTVLALACTSLGMYGDALRYIYDAITAAQRLQDDSLLCWALNRAGCIHGDMTDYEQSMRSFACSLELARELGKFEELFAALHNQARVQAHWSEFLLQRGDADRATLTGQGSVQSYLATVDLSRQGQKPGFEVMASYKLVIEQIKLGQISAAAATVARCKELLQDSRLQWLSFDVALSEIELLLAQGDAHAALRTVQPLIGGEPWRVRQTESSQADSLASRCYEQAGQPTQALHHLKLVLAQERQSLRAQADAQTRLLAEQLALGQAHDEAARARSNLQRQVGIAAGLMQERQALELRAASLQQQAHKDALTGLANRRVVDEALPRLLAAGPTGECPPLCVVMLDVDHFKHVNDRFGHAVGDQVLQRLAEVLKACTRDVDVAARWGGEEFMLLSANTPANAIAPMCERLRAMVQDQNWDSIRPGLAITISVGYGMAATAEDPTSLISRVDEALYSAKTAGRNRVVAAQAASAAVFNSIKAPAASPSTA